MSSPPITPMGTETIKYQTSQFWHIFAAAASLHKNYRSILIYLMINNQDQTNCDGFSGFRIFAGWDRNKPWENKKGFHFILIRITVIK